MFAIPFPENTCARLETEVRVAQCPVSSFLGAVFLIGINCPPCTGKVGGETRTGDSPRIDGDEHWLTESERSEQSHGFQA